MYEYASIIFNENNIVKLPMEITDNYLDYYKIEIITSTTFSKSLQIEDIVCPETHHAYPNKVALNNIL